MNIDSSPQISLLYHEMN